MSLANITKRPRTSSEVFNNLHAQFFFYFQQREELLAGIFFFGMSNSLVNPVIYGAFHLWPKKKLSRHSDRYVELNTVTSLTSYFYAYLDARIGGERICLSA